jgi:hypothetical protein
MHTPQLEVPPRGQLTRCRRKLTALLLSTPQVNAAGTLLWATEGGGERSDVGSAIAVDAAGSSLVAGTFNSASIAFSGCRALLAPHGSWEEPHWDAFVAKVPEP